MRTWSDEQLKEAIQSSKTFKETGIKLGLTTMGANYKTIRKHIMQLNLDISHFLTISEILTEARKQTFQITNENLFCINSIDRKAIRKRILRDNLIDYKCSLCNITIWQNEKLTLHLDHINGINNDNRLENLRFLCPNCHSLTDTFCGKNKKKKNNLLTKEGNHCKDCNLIIEARSEYCRICFDQNHRSKIDWPNDIELSNMVNSSSYQAVGRKLNCSGVSVKKRLFRKVITKLL